MNLTETAKNVLARSDTHAIALLMNDHREVESLFKRFEAATRSAQKIAIVNQICHALTLHAEVEERLFYPESRKVLGGEKEDMVDEAVVEHASLKDLMNALRGKRASDKLFKAYVTVLKEYVQHHVTEEENDYFPQVAKSDLDLERLGARMQATKDQLGKRLKLRSPGASVAFPRLTPGTVARPPRTSKVARKTAPRAPVKQRATAKRAAKKTRK